MMTSEPRIIPVGQEPPPMDPRPPRPAKVEREAKGKTNRRKTGNRFAVLNSFLDMTAGALTRAELLTWLILYRDCRDGTARTSQEDIARRAGMTPRAVRFALKRLTAYGLVRVVRQGGLRKGMSVYALESLPTRAPKGAKKCQT